MRLADRSGRIWAWFVAIATWVVHLLVPMPATAYGILYADLLMNTGVPAVTVGWIFSLHYFISLSSGIYVGPLCDQFGYRRVGLAGALLTGFSITATAFLKSPYLLFLLFSILYGFGAGSMFAICHFIVPHYFKKRLGLVMGLMKTGLSGSLFLAPPLLTHLRPIYGNRGAILILGAIMLNPCVCAMAFKVISWGTKANKPLSDAHNFENHKNGGNLLTDNVNSDDEVQIQEKNGGIIKGTEENNRCKDKSYNKKYTTLEEGKAVWASSCPSVYDTSFVITPTYYLVPMEENSKSISHLEHFEDEASLEKRLFLPGSVKNFCISSQGVRRKSVPQEEQTKVHRDINYKQQYSLVRGGSSPEETPSEECLTTNSEKDEIETTINKVPNNRQKKKSLRRSLGDLVVSIYTNLGLLQSHRVKLVSVANAVINAVYISGVLLVPFILNERGFSLEDASWSLSSMAISSGCSRLLVSLFVDQIPFTKRYIFMFGALCSSTGLIVYAFSTSLTAFVCAGVVFGVGIGCCLVLGSILIVEIMGVEYFSRVFTVDALVISVALLSSGPTMGFIRDFTGDFQLSIMVLCFSSLFAFALHLIIPWAASSDRKRKIAQLTESVNDGSVNL